MLFSQPAVFDGVTGFTIMLFWPAAGAALMSWKLCRFHPRDVKNFLEHWLGIAVGGILVTLVLRDAAEMLGYSASLVIALVLWFIWKHRSKGKKVARELGAKARARIEKLVRDMPRPGPVLRPVPVPVRW